MEQNNNLINVKTCPKCGGVMLFSFVLPHREYVCVPCGTGVEFCNSCGTKEITKEEYDTLKDKYKKDLQKVGLNTAKNGGGRCKTCGTKFDCESCKSIETHEFEYWGKGDLNGSSYN